MKFSAVYTLSGINVTDSMAKSEGASVDFSDRKKCVHVCKGSFTISGR